MTAVEFAKAMDYDYSTIMRWLKDERVPGARFVEVSGQFGVWQIPETALTETVLPRPGRKRGTKKTGVKKATEPSANSLPFEPPATTAKPARKAREKKTRDKKTTKKTSPKK